MMEATGKGSANNWGVAGLSAGLVVSISYLRRTSQLLTLFDRGGPTFVDVGG